MSETIATCAATGKRCYSKRDAQGVLNSTTRSHKTRQNKVIPVRCYFCEYCKTYHLTKEVKILDYNKRKQKNEVRRANDRRRLEELEASLRRYRREYC